MSVKLVALRPSRIVCHCHLDSKFKAFLAWRTFLYPKYYASNYRENLLMAILEKGGYNLAWITFFLGMEMQSKIIERNDFLFSHLRRFLNTVPGSRTWKLCYRASSHGWYARTFHSYCDGKPHTVTIIRTNQYVFGGYTDIAWGTYPKKKISYLKFLICLMTIERFRTTRNWPGAKFLKNLER